MRESIGQIKYKLNNKGMSLIEVMVAVIIMALVTAPLLHAFVTAAKFNVRSKERQRATSAAQSIMEGLKAYDLEEICYYFNGLSAFNVYPGVGSVWEEPTDLDTSAREEDGKRIFTPTLTNTYTFCIKNIPFESTFYDAQIKVSPNAAAVSSASVAAPPEMNAYLDAVYKQSPYDDENAYIKIVDEVLNEMINRDIAKTHTYTLSDVQPDKIEINKITDISITKNPSNANINYVHIEYRYEYCVKDYPYYKPDNTLGTFDKVFDSIRSSPSEEYNNEATVGNGAKLENIYVYYYPAYDVNDTGVIIKSETINISNSTGVEKNVYLIKQLNSSLTPGMLNTCENSYSPQINGSGDSIQLYHNLCTNLYDSNGTYGLPSITGVTEHTNILPTNSKVLVYDVQVSIYEKGAADEHFADPPLLTLDGSMKDD